MLSPGKPRIGGPYRGVGRRSKVINLQIPLALGRTALGGIRGCRRAPRTDPRGNQRRRQGTRLRRRGRQGRRRPRGDRVAPQPRPVQEGANAVTFELNASHHQHEPGGGSRACAARPRGPFRRSHAFGGQPRRRRRRHRRTRHRARRRNRPTAREGRGSAEVARSGPRAMPARMRTCQRRLPPTDFPSPTKPTAS